MRKAIVMLLGFVLLSAISVSMIVPAKADFTMFHWQPPYVEMVGGSRVAYRDGATVSVLIGFQNDVGPAIVMNVSKIILEFYEIGKNKTLDMLANPYQLQHDEVGIFTLSFTADSAEFYPGVQFAYNAIVEWVNATSGPKEVVGHWERAWSWVSGLRFIVYPTTQVDAMDSLDKYDSYYNYYYWYSWESILAMEKSTQAVIEKGLGDTAYDRGDYAGALAKYDLANTLWEEAMAAEKNWRTRMEDAELNVTLTESAASMKEADAAMIQANAAVNNSYAWYFIGIGFAIGFSLMGVGAVIYSLRKPKPAT